MSSLVEKSQTILDEKTLKIIPENIKKDIEIFGVKGTYDNSSDIKLFETIEDMNNDNNKIENNLAVVYKQLSHNSTINTYTDNIIFLDKVVLPNLVVDTISIEFTISGAGHNRGSNIISLSPTEFIWTQIESMGGMPGREITIVKYISTDGITYVKSLGDSNYVTSISFNRTFSSDWFDELGYFLQIANEDFGFYGLYKCVLNDDNNLEYVVLNNQFDTLPEYVYNGKTFYSSTGIGIGTLASTLSDTFEDTNALVFSDLVLKYENMEPVVSTTEKYSNLYCVPTKLDGTPLIDTSSRVDCSSLFAYNDNIQCIQNLDLSSATTCNSMFSSCDNLKAVRLINTANIEDMSEMFYACDNLMIISQLDTSSVTDMNRMFFSCDSLTTIPQLDTSSVTDMNNMFYYCLNLTAIPQLDTGNVTNMESLFQGCESLTTIPQLNTSLVTTMQYMFNFCKNLTEIPLLDTHNVTTMYSMFYYCESLTEIPLLNTSNVTDMYSMFYNCTNLITIPLLDTSKVTELRNMFKFCTLLSNDSLNNILQMCINAIAYTGTKTLKYIGLDENQATICATLSNYEAFTNAGWTTGY